MQIRNSGGGELDTYLNEFHNNQKDEFTSRHEVSYLYMSEVGNSSEVHSVLEYCVSREKMYGERAVDDAIQAGTVKGVDAVLNHLIALDRVCRGDGKRKMYHLKCLNTMLFQERYASTPAKARDLMIKIGEKVDVYIEEMESKVFGEDTDDEDEEEEEEEEERDGDLYDTSSWELQ